jgi:hypothetical protein
LVCGGEAETVSLDSSSSSDLVSGNGSSILVSSAWASDATGSCGLSSGVSLGFSSAFSAGLSLAGLSSFFDAACSFFAFFFFSSST